MLIPSRRKTCPCPVRGPLSKRAVPLVLVKNTVGRPRIVSACTSRVSVTTALLSRLKLPRSRFAFDGSVLGPSSPRFKCFAHPGCFNVIAPRGRLMCGLSTGAMRLSRKARGKTGLRGKGTFLRGLCSSLTGH